MQLSKVRYTFNSLYELGQRGLNAQQVNMNITANNISNVNTEGYTRQRVEQESATPLQAFQMNFESGVVADTVRRMRDTFFDLQLRNENPLLTMYEEEHHQLSLIEGILGEPEKSGLSYQMDQFFKSWDQLSNHPDSISSRTVVKDAGISLAETFNRIQNDLNNHQEQLNENLLDNVREANFYIKEISETTVKIMHAKDASAEISTLMDRRDLALDKLSKLIDIDYQEKDDGNLYVFCNGIIVAEGKDFNQIMTKVNKDDSSLSSLYWNNEGIDAKIEGGKIKGILNIRDRIIPDLEQKLNALVKSLVEEVNKVHLSNYDLDGESNNYFFDQDGTDMRNIAVDKNILNDVKFISAAKTAGHLGNGDGALALSELGDYKLMNGGNESMRSYYNGVITSFGTYTKETDRLAEMEKTFVGQLENKRNEVSEVDLDEELSAMIKYQQSYGAASKIIAKTEKMISDLLSLV